ncbi:MAG: redox-regulated ATPase YchF [Chloroflexi bacterium]|nr:redox-regulated ATPase YchF [Chloroflexota bacterium]
MQIGIAGLPGAGKTTVLNALARARAQVGTFTSAQGEPNRAVVKVPDSRVDTLSSIFRPRVTKPAEVQFLDVAGWVRGTGLESAAAMLGHLRTVDALLLVIAAFESGVTAESAISTLDSLEADFLLADLDLVQRRLDRLDREVRMTRGMDPDRAAKVRELELLRRVMDALEGEMPVRSLDLDGDEQKLLRGYGLLTAKPILPVLNIGDDVQAGERLLAEVRTRVGPAAAEWSAIPGRLEMELAELDPTEAREFMDALGVQDLSAGRVIQASYRLLDLISFLTVGEDEVRAWTLRRGSTALDAAGAIHSDIARGFIRAEVVRYEELVEAGTMAEVRKRGRLRVEGKTYLVQDGDVINILFNV